MTIAITIILTALTLSAILIMSKAGSLSKEASATEREAELEKALLNAAGLYVIAIALVDTYAIVSAIFG